MIKTNLFYNSPNKHFLLKYHGIQFKDYKMGEALEKRSALDRFEYLYSNLGALVMRYNLTFSQRASALQQLVEIHYSKNPVESYAQGNDDTSLFNYPESVANQNSIKCNYFLVANAHQCIGRSRVSNERMQRLVCHNKQHTHGEQKLWDILHYPVWTVGTRFHYQMSQQGFVYIACPSGISKENRLFIDKLLRSGDFNIIVDNEIKFIKCFNNQLLNVTRIDQVKMLLDEKKHHTQDENGFAISISDNKEYSALGWIMFENEKAILPQWCCEDIVKLSVLKKLGVNALNNEQRKLLFSGTLADGPLISWKENRAFNCLYNILLVLEQYQFDPTLLLNPARIDGLQKRFMEAILLEPDLIDDFLTGSVQQEMIQPLIKTRPMSSREDVPMRFTDSFEISSNTMKALAYALDIRDCKGNPILRECTVKHSSHDSDDALVKGELINPSFNSGNHVATILSTAILIAEQLLLEQLVKEAYLDCSSNPALADIHPLRQFLTTISSNPEMLWSELLKLAKVSPKTGNSLSPILGIRFSHCHDTLELFRKQTGFDKLIDICEKFSHPNTHTSEVTTNLYEHERFNLVIGLRNLYRIGNYLQTNLTTSVQMQGSRGINAGLLVLIPKIAPQLCDELNIPLTQERSAVVKPRNKSKAQKQVIMQILSRGVN